MVMTHYMELLSLHQPWFLILFMLVPMVMAETPFSSDDSLYLLYPYGNGFWYGRSSVDRLCSATGSYAYGTRNEHEP